MKLDGAHLLFVPDIARPRLFLWGGQASAMPLASLGSAAKERCITERGTVEDVDGLSIALRDALPALAAVGVAEATQLPASVSIWSAAAKFALDLISRGRLIPAIEQVNAHSEARWRASVLLGDDADRFARLANSFPPAAHAVPAIAERRGKRHKTTAVDAAEHVWTPDALLERFLNACADLLMRSSESTRAQPRMPWEQRWRRALSENNAAFAGEGFAERLLVDDLKIWIKPLAGMQGEARACFRLDLPDVDESDPNADRAQFTLRYFLQSARDSSLLMPAADVYRGGASIRRGIASSARSAQEHLLAGLAIAGRLFPPIQSSLHEARPESITMRSAVAWDFLNTAAPQLIEAGLGVILPTELTRTGQRRLRMRMRVGSARTAAADNGGADALTLNSMLAFRWQAELAGETLDIDELRELATLKAPLVRHRGRWVAVDRREVNEAIRLLEQHGGTLAAHEGLAAAFGAAERAAQTSLPVEVAVEGSFADLLTRLRAAPEATEFTVPDEFVGTLRPYQLRGAGWLATMSDLGLGACLADDMGLGKTVQFIALLLHRIRSGAAAPSLLVCPTSVIGNWERELRRFAPSIRFVRHYGPQRTRDPQAFAELEPGTLVLTTFGLMRRDWQLLSDIDWSVAALDEAQNIKNAASRTAQSARALKAHFRVALTGTPVENRLAELWSIFEFLNPRFLGPQAEFRRTYAIPIERYGQAEVAEQLKRLTQPFILRRLKSDPAIIQDLPSKQEMKIICSLTREQASLYQAALDASLEKIEEAEGIERRGQVLALLTALKQICNHPAQYLDEAGPLAGRSGKLQRIIEMLDEVVVGGDRALVFTQYREMGERLVAEFNRVFGLDVPFLHGGVAQQSRDEMVRRFQDDPRSAPIFVLSVKAGGTGLNLTAANHVFHFDRWWNPAVEDQATDRAYRIGQLRSVQVHKLMCAGTVEDKIDQLLERKRQLADSIVGAGEQWITELNDDELRDLFSLAPDAVISEDIGDAEAGTEDVAAAPTAKKRGRRRKDAAA